MKVNFIDLKKQYKNSSDSLGFEIGKIIESAQFVGGQVLDIFEKNFADYHGSKHCVGVGSGTDALILALSALGIGPGDEVIVPANTFIATAFAISHVGAIPVFVDANPKTYNISLDDVLSVISKQTKAVIPVHLYGQACNMKAIMDIARDYKLKVIEDCAQSTGATWYGRSTGTYGHCGCFSFYPTKNLGGLGQGGAVLTDDENVADTIRSLGDVGRVKGFRYKYDQLGFNSRLDTINALFLNNGLDNLVDWNFKRKRAASLYSLLLDDVADVTTPFVQEGAAHVYHLYNIKCENREIRDGLAEFLAEKDVSTGVYYPIPCHKQKIYKDVCTRPLPVSEELSNTLLALPMHPTLSGKEIIYTCNCIKEFFKNH